MAENAQNGQPQHVILFVCSGCEACEQAQALMSVWRVQHSDTRVEFISIMEEPEQVIRWGFEYTPALVVDNQLIAQNMSVKTLTQLLKNGFSNIKPLSRSEDR